MQVGALNLTNFTANKQCRRKRHLAGYKTMHNLQVQQPKPTNEQETQKPVLNPQEDNLQSMGKVVDALRKANGDINIATCAMGAGAFVVALKSGCKIAAIGRRALAMTGETVSKGAIKIASKVKKSIDAEKATKATQNFFNAVKDDSLENNKKFTEWLESVVNALVAKKNPDGTYAENIGQKVTKSANNIGLYFKAPLVADFAIASAIAIPAATTAAETTENAIDKHNVKSAAFENIKVMKDAASLVQSITDGLVY